MAVQSKNSTRFYVCRSRMSECDSPKKDFSGTPVLFSHGSPFLRIQHPIFSKLRWPPQTKLLVTVYYSGQKAAEVYLRGDQRKASEYLGSFFEELLPAYGTWWYRIIDAHEDVGKGSKHNQPVPPLSELLGMSESLSIEFLKACGVLCKYGKKGELRVRTTNHVDSLEALISKHRLDIEVAQSTHALLGSKSVGSANRKVPCCTAFQCQGTGVESKMPTMAEETSKVVDSPKPNVCRSIK